MWLYKYILCYCTWNLLVNASDVNSFNVLLEDLKNHPLAYVPKLQEGESDCQFAYFTNQGLHMDNIPKYLLNEPIHTIYERVLIYQDTYSRVNHQGENYPRFRHLYLEVPSYRNLHDTSKFV